MYNNFSALKLGVTFFIPLMVFRGKTMEKKNNLYNLI